MAINTITISMPRDPEQFREAVCTEAITPGMLLLLTSAGAVEPQPNASTLLPAYVAVENISNAGDLDTAYASGDTVRYVVPKTGDKLYMWLEETQSTTANTTLLVADTLDDGTLKAAGAETGRELKFIALESITAASSGRVRVQVEAL